MMRRLGTAVLTCLLFVVVVLGVLFGVGHGCGADQDGLPGVQVGADPAWERDMRIWLGDADAGAP